MATTIRVVALNADDTGRDLELERGEREKISAEVRSSAYFDDEAEMEDTIDSDLELALEDLSFVGNDDREHEVAGVPFQFIVTTEEDDE